ncbi:ShlB/FhaC/HecB family hemolysin secretion/activation protein [Pandoraea communis]|uniref:ShlB/FhaC/HecB family hemolysin secretion/activation protein n=1 Tax=Pandoraea communis TaxID=2508297 RepID=UPI0025A4E849|nr:ShlB/FhaC/HecB family hemolysin secretion/activation protein [Pandoraea communis]MDM8358604.1 ShlB/FhaC/HecB family hemolysin secretion/activation protein [Pandoraea communis]
MAHRDRQVSNVPISRRVGRFAPYAPFLKTGVLACGLALNCAPLAAQGPPPPAFREAARQGVQDEQLERQRREAEEREQRADAPDVRLSPLADGTSSVDIKTLPAESPCITLRRVTVTGLDGAPPAASFAFVEPALAPFVGQCAGADGVAQIAAAATEAILARGWVTTRVIVPEQNIGDGHLSLHIIPGKVSAVRFPDPSTRGTWRSAVPLRAGDTLSLNALEQGLEQLKRMPSQDADIRIEPGDMPGSSEVLIDVQRQRPWRLLASIDNSGTRDTGRLQGQLAIGVDNPLGVNDLLDVAVQHDLSTGDDRFGTKGASVSYSMPWGYNTVSIFGSTRAYFQRIAGANESFVSSGRNQTAELRLERVVRRDNLGKTAIDVRLGRRFGKSFIEDFEISQQYRNNTYLQAGATHRQYLGNAQADIALNYRQGMPWFGAQDDLRDPVTRAPTQQTYRYRMFTLDVQWSVPLQVSALTLRYVGMFHGQTTADTLWAVDQLSIGGRYSVRGFTGDQTLSAERGFFLRNELHVPIGVSAHAVYAGVDYGRVFGPSARFLPGTRLAGAVIGLRGQTGAYGGPWGNASYDIFISRPLSHPSRFPTNAAVAGISLALRY